MTIRAEDDRGYVTTSLDGLHWGQQRAWCWDDGEPLVMSSTQQRWLVHSDALFLVYTRRTAENARVVRWRAPLFVARVGANDVQATPTSNQLAVLANALNARSDFHRNPLLPAGAQKWRKPEM